MSAMRMDPPQPPRGAHVDEWWSRPSSDAPGRRLHAKVRRLSTGRVLVEYYGDDANQPPGFEQRYVSAGVAERVLEGRGWTRMEVL